MGGIHHGVDVRCRATTAPGPSTPPNPPIRTSPTGSAGSGTRPASELITSTSRVQSGGQRPRLRGAAQQQDPHLVAASAAAARRVQVAVGEALGGQHITDEDDRGAGDPGGLCICPASLRQGAAQHRLVRPARERHHAHRAFRRCSRRRSDSGDDRVDLRRGQVQHQRGAGAPTTLQILPCGIAVDSVATRLSVTVCATPGTVSSRPSAAAAAAKAGTPGTIS